MNDRKLDEGLTAWGQWQPADEAALARLIGHADALPYQPVAAQRDQRRWWMLGAGGAVAASLALGLLLMQPSLSSQPSDLASADPSASFAMLYTPTLEEEYLL